MRIGLIATAIAVVCTSIRPAGADSVEEFYRGKPLILIVGNGPGGGFDAFARLLGRHIGRFVPGNPSVVVQNMPGAGSLLAANYLYNIAPKDGTTFGLIARNMPLLGLLGGNSNVRFDPRKFTWLGSSSNFSNDAYVLIVRKDAPVRSAGEALRPDGPQLLLGGTADGGASSDVPKILRDALGLNMKLVTGYRDSAAIYLAMENDEVSGRTNELSSIKATRPSWLAADGNYRLLIQYARASRLASLPDVPTARELAASASARALIRFTEAPFTMAWPYAAPPGVPAERAGALRRAFYAAHRDPQFLAEAKTIGLDVSPVGAEELRGSIEELSRTPPEVFERARKLLTGGRGG